MIEKPRLMIAALRGGAGKTAISIGLAAAWRLYHGRRIVPFKKGPDYIDAAWLSVAAGRDCYNLDPFSMKPDEILRSFIIRADRCDGAVIEGNRGLFDGVDVRGSYSSAEVAKLLGTPVILILDATKMTRTAAALVLGCRGLDPEVNIAGVILNHVAGKRHEQVLKGAVERYGGLPVLGVFPKGSLEFFPERHLGLVPPPESKNMEEAVRRAAEKIRDCVDLEAVWSIARSAGPLGSPQSSVASAVRRKERGAVTIGVVRDAAFQFYYPENLEALKGRGAELIEVSSFDACPLPRLDALYIGGGFPEMHLEALSGNSVFRESLKNEIEAGLPVYAECGGLMFLCRGIFRQESLFPMTGVFPFDVILGAKPEGHGYTVMECVAENPFFPKGAVFRGHEFHYSRMVRRAGGFPFVFRLRKGHGIVAGWDGICYKNAIACYSHLHVVGNEYWADALIRAALRHRRKNPCGSTGAGDAKTTCWNPTDV